MILYLTSNRIIGSSSESYYKDMINYKNNFEEEEEEKEEKEKEEKEKEEKKRNGSLKRKEIPQKNQLLLFLLYQEIDHGRD